MTSHARTIAAALAITCLFGLGPSRAQQSIEEGAGDPNTAYGRSVIQNQQYQQQEQQNEQQNRQNQQDLQNQQQRFNQSNQGQGYYQSPTPVGGIYGAIFYDPTNLSISRISYNFRLPASARASAKVACYRATGGKLCNLALEFHNSCAAMAHGSNRVWAARAASTVRAAKTEATAACQRAGGLSCVPNGGYCSPNND